jgi:hypothetical protein
MNGEDAVKLIDRVLIQSQQRQLNDLESAVLIQTWSGSSYSEIADRVGYEVDYIKHIAARLWKSLSLFFGERVCKRNIQSILRRYQDSIPIDPSDAPNIEPKLPSIETWTVSDRTTEIAFFGSLAGDSSHLSLGTIELNVDDRVQEIVSQSYYQMSAKLLLISFLIVL